LISIRGESQFFYACSKSYREKGSEIAKTAEIHLIGVLSTVAEIGSALEKRPVAKQREVAAWLEARLWPETPAMLASIDEAERSLAEEGGVPVEDVRRNLSQWITK